MCGGYRLTRADRLAKKFDAELAEELHPRYNIAPTLSDGNDRLAFFHWHDVSADYFLRLNPQLHCRIDIHGHGCTVLELDKDIPALGIDVEDHLFDDLTPGFFDFNLSRTTASL